MKYKIINGNSYEELKKFPDNYFDSVVTDPPYGLGKEPNANEMLKAWIETGYMEIKGKGFMGKEWDAFVPQPLFWKEVFRVLKHGGHVVAFYGTRTYDWGVMSMRLSGFEIRDGLQWIYGSGFPKSHNISKAIDKMYGAEREVVGYKEYGDKSKEGYNPYHATKETQIKGHILTTSTPLITMPSTEQAKQWDGWGSALKPAVEPIVLARKPLEKGLTIAENVLKWGTGAINIDGCRIGFKNESDYKESTQKNQHENFGTKPMTNNNVYGDYSMIQPKNYEPQGRFPANIILTHHEDCECIGTKKVKPSNGSGKASENGGGFSKGMFGDGTSDNIGGGFTDANGEETVEDWNCVDDCPIKILDEQSGESKSSKSAKLYMNDTEGRSVKNSASGHRSPNSTYSDKGGASRFFYVAKASKNERNKGLDGFEEKIIGTLNSNSSDLKNYGGMSLGGASLKGEHKNPIPKANIHPTVKPIKLMQYLVRLITPKNGKVLDPFNGSGTTGVACMLEDLEYTGIELESDYCKISEARISKWEEEKEEKAEQKAEKGKEEEEKGQMNLFN